MTMLVHQLISKGKEELESVDIPMIEARFLLEYVLNVNYTQLVSIYHNEVTDKNIERFFELLKKRKTHYPLQYLLKHQNFCGYDFYVDESVLIPRPETERLVEISVNKIFEWVKSGKNKLKILDMCTGSGCIIISIAKQLEERLSVNTSALDINKIEIEYYAVDVSQAALNVALKNEELILCKQTIHWYKSNLFEVFQRISIEEKRDESFRFDMIISNPPYISPKEIKTLMPEVKEYEPLLALDGGTEGLDFYRKITMEGYNWIKDEGILLYEIGNGQMKEVSSILNEYGYMEIKGMKDYYNLERIVYGIKLHKPD